MATEADEPAATAKQIPQPSPQDMPPLQLPPELQQRLSQDILDGFGAEIGRLSGQLIVERKEREMERQILMAQISQAHQALKDAGVVPKSDGGESEAAPGGGAPVTPISEAPRPRPAKKAGGKKPRR